MEYLLYSRSSLWQASAFLLYAAKPLPALSKLFLLLILLAGLGFLIDGVRPRAQWLGRLGGLLMLLYAGLSLYWDLDIGFIQSGSSATSFYFGWKLLGGAMIAVLFVIADPSNTKVVPRVSGILLLAFNLLAFVLPSLKQFRLGISLYFLVNGTLIGVTVVSAVFYWLDQRRLLMKIIPADDTIVRMEKKALEWEEQAKGESAPAANRHQKMAKLSREWAAALKTGKWTS